MFMKPGDGEGIDTDALSKLLDQYTTKGDFENLKGRVEKLEKELDEFKDKSKKKLKKHKKELKDHDEEIEKLKKGKVGNDTFESEINFIKNLLNKHSGDNIDLSSMSPQFNSNEVSSLKVIINSFPTVEKDVEKIMNDLKKLDLATMKDTIQHL